MHIDDLLEIAVQSGASDLHLKVGSYPMMRVSGTLAVCSEEKRLDKADTEGMADTLFSPDQREKFRRSQEVDLAYSIPGLGRFRCNVYQQRGSLCYAMRAIPYQARTIKELNLPPVLEEIALRPRSQKPFVSINCGAIPEPLLESEERFLVRGLAYDADDDAVEHPRGPLDDVEMAVGDRIVRARAERSAPVGGRRCDVRGHCGGSGSSRRRSGGAGRRAGRARAPGRARSRSRSARAANPERSSTAIMSRSSPGACRPWRSRR